MPHPSALFAKGWAATNLHRTRINTATFDAAGNTTYDGTYNYTYDGDGHQSTVAGGGYSASYLYDPEGNRVASNVNGVTTTFGRDPGGAIAWRNYNSAQPQEIYLNGRHFGSLAMNPDHTPAHIYYSMLDQVGTEREQFDQNKNSVAKFTSLPFGEALTTVQGANPDSVHFTGKERDTESGNDYFGARYYASNMGRFMSPDWSASPEDVPYADLSNPQSLNLYSYLKNNPLRSVDADGHDSADYDNVVNFFQKFGNIYAQSTHKTPKPDDQQQGSSGTSFLSHLANLLHGHSWNYVRATVTDTETYSTAGILAPAANAAAQAAKAKVNNPGPPTPRPIPRPVPGPDPIPPQVPPGEVPEIEPGASLMEKLGVSALNLFKLLDNWTSDIVPPMYINPQVTHPYGSCPTPDCLI